MLFYSLFFFLNKKGSEVNCEKNNKIVKNKSNFQD